MTIALHVLGIIITHLREHKTTVTAASGNRYTVLLSAAIVKQLELISSNCSTIATDNNMALWLPDVVVTVVLCSRRWVIMIPETCRAIVR